jgi:hypothetical protein
MNGVARRFEISLTGCGAGRDELMTGGRVLATAGTDVGNPGFRVAISTKFPHDFDAARE